MIWVMQSNLVTHKYIPSFSSLVTVFWHTGSFWSWNVAQWREIFIICNTSQRQDWFWRSNGLHYIKKTWLDFTAVKRQKLLWYQSISTPNISTIWHERQFLTDDQVEDKANCKTRMNIEKKVALTYTITSRKVFLILQSYILKCDRTLIKCLIT